MKITKAQLLRIIKEEVRQSLAESFHPDDDVNSIPGLSETLETIESDWINRYDESDPTMSEYGRDAWLLQCDEARTELTDKIVAAYAAVEAKLIDGGFYR